MQQGRLHDGFLYDVAGSRRLAPNLPKSTKDMSVNIWRAHTHYGVDHDHAAPESGRQCGLERIWQQ